MEMAEKRTQWIKGIMDRALSILKPGDVNGLDGRPYINAMGAYKIARLFGVSIKYGGRVPQKVTGQDDVGVYYFYVHGATVALPNGIDSVDVIGNCSSRDKFFAMVRGEWRPQSDVDELDIMQKCVTNCDRKGIVKLLGLDNVTWDDLLKYAKITQTQCSNFSFKKPASNSSASPSNVSVAPSADQKAVAGAVADSTSHALPVAARVNSPFGTGTPKAESLPAQPGASGPKANNVDQAVASDGKSLRQVALEHIEEWRGRHDVTLVHAIKTLTGGKSSLGQLNDDELEGVITKCNQDSGS
jgi:hypothetical protein